MKGILLTGKQIEVLRNLLMNGWNMPELNILSYKVVDGVVDATHIEPKMESFVFDLRKLLESQPCGNCGHGK